MTRLDRFLSDATGASRSEVKKWLRAGRVCVGGETVRTAGFTVPADGIVTFDGRDVAAIHPRYIMLNKALGTVCTAPHADPRSVLNGVADGRREPLQCVGRLDVDTSGLLLITDDGAWNHRVSRPGRVPKQYLAELADPVADEALDALLRGVALHRETKPGVAHSVCRVDPRRVRIAVLEGRYHLVRRLFAAVGHRVTGLHRESIGALQLDSTLAPGEWRDLTPDEQALFAGD